jgi:hypothetical protein
MCSTIRFELFAWSYVAERILSGSEYTSGKGVGVCERDYAQLYIAALTLLLSLRMPHKVLI